MLKDFKLFYEDLPSIKSRLYTVELRKVFIGTASYTQRIFKRKASPSLTRYGANLLGKTFQ